MNKKQLVKILNQYKKKLQEALSDIREYIDLKNTIKQNKKKRGEVEELLNDKDIQLKKTIAKVKHFEKLYSGLEQIKTLHHSTNGEAESKTLSVYKKEISRLQALLEKYQEQLAQTVFSSDILQLEEPKLVKTAHPIKLFK